MTLGLISAIAIPQPIVVEEAPPPESASLSRIRQGLILFDDFNRGDQSGFGGSWSTIAGNPAIVSNEFTENASAGIHRAEFVSPIVSGTFMWQHGAVTTNMNVNARRSTGIVNFINYNFQSGGSSLIQYIVSGSGGPSTNPNAGVSTPAIYRGVIIDTGTSMTASLYRADVGAITDLTSSFSKKGSSVEAAGSNYWITADRWRIVFNDNAVGDNWILMAGSTIRIDGLSAGFKARVIGADLTGSSVVESGGIATIDMAAEAMPASRVEVLDGSDELIAFFFSGSGVWAGDIYTFTGE